MERAPSLCGQLVMEVTTETIVLQTAMFKASTPLPLVQLAVTVNQHTTTKDAQPN